MGKVPSVMPISRINWIPKTKGSHGVYFERKIKLSTIPPPVNGLELLLDLTPNCSAKCGKSVQQASGVFPIQLQSYKQTLEVADFFTLTRSTSFQ